MKLHCFHWEWFLGWKTHLLKASPLEGIRHFLHTTKSWESFNTKCDQFSHKCHLSFPRPTYWNSEPTQARKFLVLIGDLQNLASFLDSSLSQKAKKNHRSYTHSPQSRVSPQIKNLVFNTFVFHTYVFLQTSASKCQFPVAMQCLPNAPSASWALQSAQALASAQLVAPKLRSWKMDISASFLHLLFLGKVANWKSNKKYYKCSDSDFDVWIGNVQTSQDVDFHSMHVLQAWKAASSLT